MFVVVRHPDITDAGVIPADALELQRTRGWYRVSDPRHEPAAFHLPEFDESCVDLDAEPEPEPTTVPAAPDKDEEH